MFALSATLFYLIKKQKGTSCFGFVQGFPIKSN
jgi:hypothetical protein